MFWVPERQSPQAAVFSEEATASAADGSGVFLPEISGEYNGEYSKGLMYNCQSFIIRRKEKKTLDAESCKTAKPCCYFTIKAFQELYKVVPKS